ncbi:MAG: cell division protein ZipA C-terminal FtsZ-binding domain-containing protein [Burkholderiaceae bacterium]
MTDLQVSLIAIGGIIVAGVVSYNKWQEHKARKSVDRAFSGSHDDVLMAPPARQSDTLAERTEPTFAVDEMPAEAPPETGESVVPPPATSGVAPAAPGLAPAAPDTAGENAAPQPAASFAPDLPLDELVDCIVPVALEAPVRGEKLLQAFQSLRHVGNKPVHAVGQTVEGRWEPIAHGNVYGDLMVGVQLANRSGALNEIEYSELVSRLRQIADGFGAEPESPDMPKVMTSARALQQFVSAYDARLSVNVRANRAAWEIGTLLAALERQGFDLRPDGKLVMPDGDGGALFSLSTNVTMAAETTSALTLLLNVPCVARERDGFGAMIACARMLANRLDGTMVDDGGQPLSDATLSEIGEQVEVFYDDMRSADIPAGSARALRLFS